MYFYLLGVMIYGTSMAAVCWPLIVVAVIQNNSEHEPQLIEFSWYFCDSFHRMPFLTNSSNWNFKTDLKNNIKMLKSLL